MVQTSVKSTQMRNLSLKLLTYTLIAAFCVSVLCFGYASRYYQMFAIRIYVSQTLIALALILFALSKGYFDNNALEKNLSSFLLVSNISVLIGLLQLCKILPSLNSFSPFTGTFGNVNELAMMLSFLYPVCLYKCFTTIGEKQNYYILLSVLYVLLTITTQCRTAYISQLITTCIIVFTLYPSIRHKSITVFKKFWPVLIILVAVFIYIIYKFKEDSANGRLLVWLVSIKMIIDKPLFGFGVNGFAREYMSYQADYFQMHPDSQFAILADNVVQPFNEFINITIAFGIFGLLLFILLLVLLFKHTVSDKSRLSCVNISVLSTFVVWCMFSYPLSEPFVWIIMTCMLFISFGNYCNKLCPKIYKIVVVISSIWFVFSVVRTVYITEWKRVERLSLMGHTSEMIPQYAKLYDKLHWNSKFLYNYGAELHYIKDYNNALPIMEECQTRLNDYDVQVILADTYQNLGDMSRALICYTKAWQMIPNRFLPLYKEMLLYDNANDTINAQRIARQLLNKDIKVSSSYIDNILQDANEILNDCQ